LGERLAALAAKNCRAYPGVEIHNTAFEDWVLEEISEMLKLPVEVTGSDGKKRTMVIPVGMSAGKHRWSELK